MLLKKKFDQLMEDTEIILFIRDKILFSSK